MPGTDGILRSFIMRGAERNLARGRFQLESYPIVLVLAIELMRWEMGLGLRSVEMELSWWTYRVRTKTRRCTKTNHVRTKTNHGCACQLPSSCALGEKLQEPEQRGEPIEPDDGLPGKGTTPVMVVNLRPGPCITQFDPKSGEVHLWYKS